MFIDFLKTCEFSTKGIKRFDIWKYDSCDKVFFNSVDEAKAEGLEPAKNCPGLE